MYIIVARDGTFFYRPAGQYSGGYFHHDRAILFRTEGEAAEHLRMTLPEMATATIKRVGT